MDTFLTEAKSQAPERKKNPQLANVRKEHGKLAEIVNSFGHKVDYMVDKQRNEYIQAYGHHMRDVQKELHLLREKATAIANDRTRDEKIKKLDSDQKWYRNEAIRLDAETNVLRKKLKSLTSTISSVERERDWLLAKLREAKRKYRALQKVRAQKNNALPGPEEGNMSVFSNDSSYLLDFDTSKQANTGMNTGGFHQHQQWKSRLENDYGVSRDESMMGALAHMTEVLEESEEDHETQSVASKQQRTKRLELHHHTPGKKSLKAKQTLGKLVAMRAKQDAIGDFVSQCSYSCHKGIFNAMNAGTGTGSAGGSRVNSASGGAGGSRVNSASGGARAWKPRPVDQLVEACLQHLSTVTYNEQFNIYNDNDMLDTFSSVNGGGNRGNESTFHSLVKELACSPDTYIAISDIMSGLQKGTSSSGNNNNNNNSGMNRKTSDNINTSSTDTPFVSNSDTDKTLKDMTNMRSTDINYNNKEEDDDDEPNKLRIDGDIFSYLTIGNDRRLNKLEKTI